MPASEIDDIFASKGKAKAKPASDPVPVAVADKKSKKIKKKRKAEQLDDDAAAQSTSKAAKPKVAVTVFSEPSAEPARPSKKQKVAKTHLDATASSTKTSKKSSTAVDASFGDSRGIGPREQNIITCPMIAAYRSVRQNDRGRLEGLQGGRARNHRRWWRCVLTHNIVCPCRRRDADTALCPFDCDCCKSFCYQMRLNIDRFQVFRSCTIMPPTLYSTMQSFCGHQMLQPAFARRLFALSPRTATPTQMEVK